MRNVSSETFLERRKAVRAMDNIGSQFHTLGVSTLNARGPVTVLHLGSTNFKIRNRRWQPAGQDARRN